MMAEFPESYKDDSYGKLDSANEQKYGLPVGLVSSIREYGEKTNASEVSSAKAKTPYQFIPSTQKAILDKYGIDVTLSPDNASEGAALLLKEGLDRSKGDIEHAVRSYHGGTDPKNWGKVNDAYWSRVSAGLEGKKSDALSSNFSQWMQQNPAIPDKPQEAAKPADKLSGDFANWLKNPTAQSTEGETLRAGTIPGQPNQAPTQEAPSSITDKIIGAGEAGLSTAANLTLGAGGYAAGALGGIAESVQNGTFGTQAGVNTAADSADRIAGQVTAPFQPRTPEGQKQAAAIGEGMNALVPVMPLTAEMGALGQGMKSGAALAKDIALPKVMQAVDAVKQRAQGAQEPAGVSAMPGSVGAAGADVAVGRMARAEDLPVPINLTKAQATRDFTEQQFERETAKLPEGAPLRDRYAAQNDAMLRNFDAMVDMTGADAAGLRQMGQAVDKALIDKVATAKTKIKTLYKEAEKAGELEALAPTANITNFLNQSSSAESLAPVLGAAKKELIRLGGAVEAEGGGVAPTQLSLKDMEFLRKFVNKVAGADPTNIKYAVDLKNVIDASTDGLGGNLYKKARASRSQFAKEFEDRAVINRLITTKPGTSDRRVAYEDTFNHIVLNGSLDDIRHVRRVLQTDPTGQGAQAWREVQGQTINWLKEESTKNVARDVRGNEIVSASGLDKAVRTLDKDQKLDFIFGKKGAEQIRDLNDLAKDVYTAPPGSVNSSNTASALKVALDALITGAVTGIPAPAFSALKEALKFMKNRKTAARIRESLSYGKQDAKQKVKAAEAKKKGSK